MRSKNLAKYSAKNILKKLFKKCLTVKWFFCIVSNCAEEIRQNTRAYSSAGRASALQAGGHRFEPYYAHHLTGIRVVLNCGPVVQLVRMPACHAGGRRFEPVPDRQISYAGVAQR